MQKKRKKSRKALSSSPIRCFWQRDVKVWFSFTSLDGCSSIWNILHFLGVSWQVTSCGRVNNDWSLSWTKAVAAQCCNSSTEPVREESAGVSDWTYEYPMQLQGYVWAVLFPPGLFKTWMEVEAKASVCLTLLTSMCRSLHAVLLSLYAALRSLPSRTLPDETHLNTTLPRSLVHPSAPLNAGQRLPSEVLPDHQAPPGVMEREVLSHNPPLRNLISVDCVLDPILTFCARVREGQDEDRLLKIGVVLQLSSLFSPKMSYKRPVINFTFPDWICE